MEAAADTQQGGETAVSESEAQQITLTQVNLSTMNCCCSLNEYSE